ncbi:MAG: glycosyltransferase [Bacteroidaceae bacterium]|nr:glycosyltransferase [Bacteroidaceae bacterium]
MKILLIVGNANDIFITNMTKWLKKSMPDATIDIFDFFHSNIQEENTYCDNLHSSNSNIWFNKVKIIQSLYPFYASRQLKKFLKGKHYDLIQCHRISPIITLTNCLKKHCNKLFATFWGGELDNVEKILFSKKIYNTKLDSFISRIDYVINSKATLKRITEKYPSLAKKRIEAYLGSAPLEEVYKLMEKEDKEASKEKLSIPTGKKVVLIGYSGKALHQHLPIIDELARRDDLKEKLHLLTPMTRGGNANYCDEVDAVLKKSGYTYTLLRDRFLNDEEVARLRNATDITLQFSTFDAFSRSIIECLCAKSVLVYGNWLDYKEHLANGRLIAHPVSTIEEGIDKLSEIANNIDKYSKEVEENHINGKAKNLWSECIADWVNAYLNTK